MWPGSTDPCVLGKFSTTAAEESGVGGVRNGVMGSTTLLASGSGKAREAIFLNRDVQTEGEGGGEGKKVYSVCAPPLLPPHHRLLLQSAVLCARRALPALCRCRREGGRLVDPMIPRPTPHSLLSRSAVVKNFPK